VKVPHICSEKMDFSRDVSIIIKSKQQAVAIPLNTLRVMVEKHLTAELKKKIHRPVLPIFQR
jgi:hypothetical protein